MFGWMRKKENKPKGRGLIYGGSSAPEPTTKAAEPGGVRNVFETDSGQLEMRDTVMVLAGREGSITVPYHQVDAWDDSGKKFRVWWSTPGQDPHHYTMSCMPQLPAATLAAELRGIIHRNTFEE